MSNYSDDAFGMNCPATVLQTVYNRIHPLSDDEMLGAISFEEIAALGCAGPLHISSHDGLVVAKGPNHVSLVWSTAR